MAEKKKWIEDVFMEYEQKIFFEIGGLYYIFFCIADIVSEFLKFFTLESKLFAFLKMIFFDTYQSLVCFYSYDFWIGNIYFRTLIYIRIIKVWF